MPGELRSGERGRQLHQRERISARLLDQTLADEGRRLANIAREQHRRGLAVEPREMERRNVGCCEAPDLALSGREQHDDPFRFETASHEHEGVGGGRVQPVRVVDETQ